MMQPTPSDTSSDPSTTVVIPCYNAEDFISRSIQSVLNQDGENVEIVVIDDGSTDKSLDAIKSFGGRVRWVTGPNCGAATARNRGLELGSSEFILFLDADDYIQPDSVREWVAQGSDADIVLGPWVAEIGGRIGAPQLPDKDAVSIRGGWLSGTFTAPCSVLWRRAFLCGIGGWNSKAVRNDDGELMIRAILKGARVAAVPRGLGVYVQHDSPGRVSKGSSREAVSSLLSCSEELWALAQAEGYVWLRQSFAMQFYVWAGEAFACGFDDIGQRALCRARELGLKGHPGSFSHRTLVQILGLKNKSRFARMVRNLPARNPAAAWRIMFPTAGRASQAPE
jgi:glycosyltransferase involved in cell wall biosynthesis